MELNNELIEASLKEIKEPQIIKKYNLKDNDIEFIDALKIVSDVKLEDVNNNDVIQSVKSIQKYVGNNVSSNEVISTLFGFGAKSEIDIDEISKKTKEYLYFISDIKIKATVYLLRICSFFKSWEKEWANNIKSQDNFINRVKNTTLKSIFEYFGESSDSIEKYNNYTIGKLASKKRDDWESSENKFNKNISYKYISHCVNYLKNEKDEKNADKYAGKADELEQESEIKLMEREDVKSLQLFLNFQSNEKSHWEKTITNNNAFRYYLFDNSMKEIDFCGICRKWRWKYLRADADLFRCEKNIKETKEMENMRIFSDIDENDQPHEYYKKMIKKTVNHMNGEMQFLSFSKNPYRDIYKYLDFQQNINTEFIISGEIGSRKPKFTAKLSDEDEQSTNKSHVYFIMVKKANTNIFHRKNNKAVGFFDFINSMDDFKAYVNKEKIEPTYFCLDVLNNSITTDGDIRNVFQEYTNSFPGIEISGLTRQKVAPSDEEVVMNNYIPNEIKIDDNTTEFPEYDKINANMSFRVELDRKDIISLFRKISISRAKENYEDMICELKDIFSQQISFNNIKVKVTFSDCENDLNEHLNKRHEYERKLRQNLSKEDRESIENLKEQENTLIKEVEKAVCEAVSDYLKSYGKEKENTDKMNFIMSFIEGCGHIKKRSDFSVNVFDEKNKDKIINIFRHAILK